MTRRCSLSPCGRGAGVRGIPVRVFNRCHSGLVPLVIPDISPPVIPNVSYAVIPDVSHPVIPDVINRKSKAGLKRAQREPEKLAPPAKPPPRSRKEKSLDSR